MKIEKYKLNILISLFLQFFKIGAVTFGGGLAMLPIFKRDLVDSKKWVTEDEMIDYFSIAQCTPGVIAVNTATFVGHKQAGFFGSLVSTIGVVLPSIIIISLVAAFISNFHEIEWVQKAFKGILVAVSVLLLKAVTKFAKKTLIDVYTMLIAIIAFILIFFFKVAGVWIVLGASLMGYLIQTIKLNRHLRSKK